LRWDGNGNEVRGKVEGERENVEEDRNAK